MAHILPDPQMERGWICPQCERGVGPWVARCPCRDAPYPTLNPLLFPPDPYPERRLPDYCWRSWPPRHTDTCGCVTKSDTEGGTDEPSVS